MDRRKKDIKLLEKYGLNNGYFGELWEGCLSRIEGETRNQERWALARRSMLAGYLLAKDNHKLYEIKDIVSDDGDDN